MLGAEINPDPLSNTLIIDQLKFLDQVLSLLDIFYSDFYNLYVRGWTTSVFASLRGQRSQNEWGWVIFFAAPSFAEVFEHD